MKRERQLAPRDIPRDVRVLDVLDADLWTTSADVRRLARMDASTCIYTLGALVQAGEVEFSRLYRGRGNGSGRPQHLYRLAVRNRVGQATQEAA